MGRLFVVIGVAVLSISASSLAFSAPAPQGAAAPKLIRKTGDMLLSLRSVVSASFSILVTMVKLSNTTSK